MTTALLAAAAFGAGAPAPDPPGIVLQRVAAPTHVAARDGVAVFGAFDPADLWLNRRDRAPRRVARVRTGGASSGLREYLQPRLSARSVTSYQQGRDQGNGVQRWSLGAKLLGAGSIGLAATNDRVPRARLRPIVLRPPRR